MSLFIMDEARPDLGGNVRHGDSQTWCANLWRYLIDRFAISSVLDVGCGEGHAARFFHKQGLYAHGIDGLLANVERAVMPIALHDLRAGPYVMPVDMVWSCEVAEHIDLAYLSNYLDTLANGVIIAMTYALPGQAGYHHVNCQPSEYWIELIEQRGYRLSPDNEMCRKIANTEPSWNYFCQSGLVFLRT